MHDFVTALAQEYRFATEAARNESFCARRSRSRDKVIGRIKPIADMMADRIGDYAEMEARLATKAYWHNFARIMEALNSPEPEASDARLPNNFGHLA